MRIKKASIYFFGVIAADQLTKYFALQSEFFSSAIVENPGLPIIGPLFPGFFNILILIFFLVIFLFLALRYLGSSRTEVWLIAGGACSNLIDRIDDGAVTDWIYIFKISTMNLADIAIIFGMIYILIRILKSKSL